MTEYLSLYRGVPPASTMREIAALVAERYGLTLDDLRGPVRARTTAHARQEAMVLIRKQGRHSLQKIGQFFNRDHTTVIWAIRAHKARASGERLHRKCHVSARPA